VAVNRVRGLLEIEEPHPGTSDAKVSPWRLVGREAFRSGATPGHSQSLAVPEGHRVEFWLGWYDERLRRLFGR